MSTTNNFKIDLTKFSIYKKEIFYIIVATFKLCFKWIKHDLKREDFEYNSKLENINKKEHAIMLSLNKFFTNNTK